MHTLARTALSRAIFRHAIRPPTNTATQLLKLQTPVFHRIPSHAHLSTYLPRRIIHSTYSSNLPIKTSYTSFNSTLPPKLPQIPQTIPQTPLVFAVIPTLSRDMDIEYYANEQHYKENIEYVETGDKVVNIRQIQRIIMKDAFLCKKYMRYILETIEDAKEMLHMTQRRVNMMIEATEHEPTLEIYKKYLLKIDEEIDALEGFMQLGLLTVMPVSNIHKHLFRQIDENHNDGGLDAEFNLARHQFDVVHEQLNQVSDLSNKCDGLVEVVDNVIVEIFRRMMADIDQVEDNKIPHDLQAYHGGDDLMYNESGQEGGEIMPEYLELYYKNLGIDQQRAQRDQEIRKNRQNSRNDAGAVMNDPQYKSRGKNMPQFEAFDDAEDDFADFIIQAVKQSTNTPNNPNAQSGDEALQRLKLK